MSKLTVPFCYPTKPHLRKHGPSGYKKWESYRDWLRDEFDFRCVYCLRREIWDRRRALWVVEHLVPRETDPFLELEYTNLLYACTSCNSAKSAQTAPDPCKHAYGALVKVTVDGRIHAQNREGKRLIRHTALDENDATRWRETLIHLLRAWKKHEPERYRRHLSFPQLTDLPDLEKLCPPAGNTKPEGAKNCRFRQQQESKLPGIYLV